MITKKEADQSDSFLAQGGICMLRGEDDYEDYFEDTMRAGHYENNKKAVDLMLRSSNSIIRDLLTREVDFERNEKGDLEFTREGAHSQPRILFHEDITGCLLYTSMRLHLPAILSAVPVSLRQESLSRYL